MRQEEAIVPAADSTSHLSNMVHVIWEVWDDRFNHRDEIFPFQSSINRGEEDNRHSYTNKGAVCSKEKHLSLFDSGS